MGTAKNKTERALPKSGWSIIIPTGIRWSRGKAVLTKNKSNQGLTNSDGWIEINPRSIQRREPRVILFKAIGARRNKQQAIKTIHFEEVICLGLMNRPIKNNINPTTQAIICFTTESGAMELIIKMLIQKRKAKLITIGSQGFFDINKF